MQSRKKCRPVSFHFLDNLAFVSPGGLESDHQGLPREALCLNLEPQTLEPQTTALRFHVRI